MEKRRKITDFSRRILLAFLCTLLFLGGCLGLSISGKAAMAAGSGHLTVGNKISYAGYSTNWFGVDGVIAYCGNPSQATPTEGTYSKNPISAANPLRNSEVRADLWFCWGGPGFNRNMWPSTWYDGTAMTDERYAALVHILLSDTFSSNFAYATAGCNSAFKNWVRTNITGFDDSGQLINANAVGVVIARQRQGEVPVGFEAFMLYTGSNTQLILSYSYNPKGTFQIQKSSAQPSPNAYGIDYTLRGAVFQVYSDAALSKQVATLTTDANGKADSPELAPGTYYVKEVQAPQGFELNTKVYTVTVTGGKVSYCRVTDNALGVIKLKKQSSDEGITMDNSMYSLQGAEYGVYSDEGCSNLVTTMTTDENGVAYSSGLPAGTYYLRELSAPSGFAIDTETTATVEVVAGATSSEVLFADEPNRQTLTLLIGKYDGSSAYDAAANQPQGDAALQGAQFTVNYYDGLYEEGTLPAEPTRSWVFETDENGFAWYRESSKVSGPDLYVSRDGAFVLPLGTVTIRETAAPEGYTLIDPGTGEEPSINIFQITADASVVEVGGVNPAAQPDAVQRGDYRLIKEVPIEGETGDQDDTRILLEGIQFQIINRSEYPVMSPQTGSFVGEGEVVCTITTNEDGFASTRAGSDINGWDIPEGWTGALAYGTYSVREIIPDAVASRYSEEYGLTLQALEDWNLVIDKDGQYNPAQLVTNHYPQTPLRIVKKDAETGEAVPLHASFQLFDEEGKLVTYTDPRNPDEVQNTWTTGSDGSVLLPMKLEVGTYYIHEVEAPEGYVNETLVDDVAVEVVVDGYRTWADPIVVVFNDRPIKGAITLVKTDSVDGTPVAGATYLLYAAEDVVTPDGTVRFAAGELIGTGITASDGTVVFKDLYLGTYTVAEGKTAQGYALDTSEHTVTLESEGQDVPVVERTLELSDQPTTVEIAKVDAATGEPLANAEFRVVSDDGTFDCRLTTDEDGSAVLDHLAPGTYSVQELQAPLGYVAEEDASWSFTVDDQGLINGFSFYRIEVANTPIALSTHAMDKLDGDSEVAPESATAIMDVVVYDGLVDGSTYRVEGILMDPETGEEIIVNGNHVTGSRTFQARDEEGFTIVEFEYDAASLAGTDVVVFEYLYDEEDRLVAKHCDLQADSQTLSHTSPAIATQARDLDTGSHEGYPKEEMTVVDQVAYEGLVPGEEYELKATLMDPATGEPVLHNGQPATATKTFVPDESAGSVDIDVTFSRSAETEFSVVAFEELSFNGRVIATHEDLESESQTVVYEPKILTSLSDASDGDGSVVPSKAVTVEDEVVYFGLVPGTEYRMDGILMDKATGTAVEVSGSQIVSSTSFIPEESSGTVKVTFTFDASGLDGKTLVAFEDCYCDGQLVAQHADINDAAQTIVIESTPATPSNRTSVPKTGDTVLCAVIGLALMVGLGTGLTLYGKRRRWSMK